MTEDIKYTPKQVAHHTGIGYRKILKDIKNDILKAKKDDGEQSYMITQTDLVDYLASLNEDLKDEFSLSLKSTIQKNKLKEVREDFIKAINDVKDKHRIPLSLNIESK